MDFSWGKVHKDLLHYSILQCRLDYLLLFHSRFGLVLVGRWKMLTLDWQGLSSLDLQSLRVSRRLTIASRIQKKPLIWYVIWSFRVLWLFDGGICRKWNTTVHTASSQFLALLYQPVSLRRLLKLSRMPFVGGEVRFAPQQARKSSIGKMVLHSEPEGTVQGVLSHNPSCFILAVINLAQLQAWPGAVSDCLTCNLQLRSYGMSHQWCWAGPWSSVTSWTGRITRYIILPHANRLRLKKKLKSSDGKLVGVHTCGLPGLYFEWILLTPLFNYATNEVSLAVMVRWSTSGMPACTLWWESAALTTSWLLSRSSTTMWRS